MKPALRLDPISYTQAQQAVENWHYSNLMPQGCRGWPRYGVWENDQFIGVVVFGTGPSPQWAGQFGLTHKECFELVRVALDKHETEVTRIISIALRLVRKDLPELRLVVSYADPKQGHDGKIYRAGNWLYAGKTDNHNYLKIAGKVIHPRTCHCRYGTQSLSKLNEQGIKAKFVKMEGKHKYLYPLDEEIRQRVQPKLRPWCNS